MLVRAAAVLLVLGLVVPGFTVGEPVWSHAQVGPGWRALATPELVNRVEAGAGSFELIVTGPPHAGADIESTEDRARAQALLEQRSAGFMGRVKDVALDSGGEVVGAWPAVPAVRVTGDLEVLRALGHLGDARQIALDHAQAVRLVDDGPSDAGDRLEPSNVEGRQMVKAQEVWDLGYRGDGVTVAVIDSGVDPTHEAFRREDGSSRIVRWADCVENGCDSSGQPYDDNGHGTHVAGTVAGSSVFDDPEWGVYEETGVAPEASLLVAKFLRGDGGGSFSGALDALEWSFLHGADVTVNSWGGSCSWTAVLIEMVDQYAQLGMISVFAAGNSGPGAQTVLGPACGEPSLAVGAIDEQERLASFSSRGPCTDPRSDSDWTGTCPDLVAKGVGVRSAIPRSGAMNSDPSGYKAWQGTSMATPIVAGVVVLAEQMKRAFTGEGWETAEREEWRVLKACAKPLPVDGESPNDHTGWGLPDLLCVHDTLVEASSQLVFSSQLSRNVVRSGERTEFTWSLENRGDGTVTGDLRVILERPDGIVELLHGSRVEVGAQEAAQVSVDYAFDGSAVPGGHRIVADYSFEWENATAGFHARDEQMAAFDVVRPQVSLELDLADQAAMGSVQTIGFVAVNEGNEDAVAAGVTFVVPQQYLFDPQGADPEVPDSMFAEPAPDEVEHDLNKGVYRLTWRGVFLPPGGSFSFESDLSAAVPGDHRFLSFVEYEDTRGHAFALERADDQEVTLV